MPNTSNDNASSDNASSDNAPKDSTPKDSASSDSALLTVDNLSVAFSQSDQSGKVQSKTVVEGISFTVNRGEIVALVGESGSGKSVTAHSLLRLLPYPSASHPTGTIHLAGDSAEQDLLKIPDGEMQQVRGRRISMIFQEPMMALNPLHTVYKQIAECLLTHNPSLSTEAVKARVIELLYETGIPEPNRRLSHYPSQLSGGQRQRVMIAMALANEPDLLIADEPTTALDVTIQLQILNLLQSLQSKHNLAILLITHDFNVVRQIANRCLVMQHGKLVEKVSAEALFDKAHTDQRHPYTKALLEAEPSGAPLTNPESKDPQLLAAKRMKVWFPIHKGIFKRVVDHFKAVDNISFSIKRGETVGIVGESGSGKSTLAMAILKLIQSEGSITFRGQYLDRLTGRQLRPVRKELQIVFQDPFGSLSPRLSIEQIIEEGLLVHQPHLSASDRRDKVVKALKEVDLDAEICHRYPHEFSGGQRQRIAIARALVLQPKLIVLDEPTSALDRSVQGQVLDLLRRLQKKHGLSYLFISHDLKVVRVMSHRVIVMQGGKVVETGPAEQLFLAPQTDYTQALLEAAFI